MDKEVRLICGIDEDFIGYASEFLLPRDDRRTLEEQLFSAVQRAVEVVETSAQSSDGDEFITITVE